jgi:hypothetical protein
MEAAIVSQSIEVNLMDGVLCADFNEGRLIIDTGSPVSLGPDVAIQILGNSVQLLPNLLNYSWEQIKATLPFEAAGLVGVDAFTGSVISLDLKNSTLAVLGESIEGPMSSFIMGSPAIRCQIGEESVLCVVDTGAGLSYLTERELCESSRFVGLEQDFHPILGSFEVETYELPVTINGKTIVEKFGLAPAELKTMLEMVDVGGILGTSFFAHGVLNIDFKNEVVAFDVS